MSQKIFHYHYGAFLRSRQYFRRENNGKLRNLCMKGGFIYQNILVKLVVLLYNELLSTEWPRMPDGCVYPKLNDQEE